MSSKGITLGRHLSEQRHKQTLLSDDICTVLTQVAFASKILAREMRRAALVGRLGLSGERNVTGDAQKKLDVFGNDVVLDAFAETGLVAAITSEELDEPQQIVGGADAQYVLSIDPLDGSSNCDINGTVGTIFSIHRRLTTGSEDINRDFFRKGSDQVAAGYAMYGPSTVLVYSVGSGVNGFTLDHDIGEFLLSHEDIRCPRRGHYYSTNMGYYNQWHPNIQKFIQYLSQEDQATNRPYSLRYSGALVADLHRCLLEGGLYFYPADTQQKEGKLRLLYECAPLALIIEHAGGQASTGTQRVLDIQAESIHQRVPLVIGSAEEVALYERFLRDGHA